MSTIATARAEFAAALNAIDGITYYAAAPGTPRAGDAWLRWRLDRSESSGGYEMTWFVCVVTPSTEAAADEWIDARLPALLSGLRRVAWVSAAEPATLATDNGPGMPGLLITTNRE